MHKGLKENSMTVSYERQQKRQAHTIVDNTAVQCIKRLRVLETVQIPNDSAICKAGVAVSNLSPTPGATTASGSVKALKKRSRIDESEAYCASSAEVKRGKRLDGSCTASISPRAAAAALDAQLTFPGLEKDPDLEVQHVYISRQLLSQQQQQQQHIVSTGAQPTVLVGGDDRVSALHSQTGLSDTAKDCTRDADKSSRGRDQAHNNRHRDQQQPSASTDMTEVSIPTLHNETPEPEEHVCLNLVTDKEWQRLFAVLTISGQSKQKEQQQCASNADGASSSAAAAALAEATVEVAPATPTRQEADAQASLSAACGSASPAPRSFLLREFTRVQARMTPERRQQQQRWGH